MSRKIVKESELKKGVVVQHNTLIEACHRMTLTEMRIMNAFISTLRRDGPNNIDREFILSINDYNNLYGISDTIRSVSAAVDRLFTRSVLLQGDCFVGSSYKYKKRRIAFVSSAGYSDGIIGINFTREIIALLEELTSNFTPIPLEVISKLQTTYGIRLLELLKQYLKIGNRTISVSNIRDMFDLNDKYKVYADFKKRVIQCGVDDINKNTDYTVGFTQIKENRRVVAFEFTIKKRGKENNLETNDIECSNYESEESYDDFLKDL